MADPMAAYRAAGPDPQRDPRLLPLAASSDLHGTQSSESSRLTGIDLEIDIPLPLGFTDLPPGEGPMSAYEFDRLLPAAASSDLRRCFFGGRRRRRHTGLPLPIGRATTLSDRNARAKLYFILEDIVQYTLSTLHNIQKSLLYWESIAEGTNLRQMYFMIFERGPRAFLETTWQTLTGLCSTSPSQFLLNSAANMVWTKLDALATMQDCLATFLAEVYSEVDKRKGRLAENSEQSLRALLIILNPLFSKLELSLRTLAEVQPASLTQPIFQTLPEGHAESSTAIKLIYQNLLMLDSFISNKLAVHQKPRNKTIYWLPYTCGAIGLSACSLWLLGHSSFMASSDMDGSILAAKESVAGYWDQHVVDLIISTRDGLYRTFKQTNKLIWTKQVVHPIEASSHRAMLEPTQILEGNEINLSLCAVWHAFGLCGLLFLLLRAPFFHDQDEEERGKMSRLPQRLLLRDVELRFMEFQKCMTNGMKKKADSKFGLILCDLDRLYKAVEFHAKKTGEWSSVRQDIVDLANPHMRMSDRLVVLSRLKEMYYCLLPSPSPSMYYPPSL